MLNSLLSIASQCRRLSRQRTRPISRFGTDTTGVAAVEFAMIASVLILIMLGMCDVVPAWLVSNNVQNAAATTADVTGKFTQMQPSDMVSVYAAASDVMAPFSANNQSLRITSVFSDGNGNAKVQWSCGMGNLLPSTALSAVTSTPTGASYTSFLYLYRTFVGIWLDGTNTSYIVTEVSYTYTAPAQFVLRSPLNLSGVSYYLPRSSAYVGFPWDGTTANTPTVPTSATRSSSMQLSNGATCNYAS